MLAGQPFRFHGLNIYNANSRDNCSYNLQTGNALDQTLNAIGDGNQNVFRAWFYQQLATTHGARDWAAFDHTLAVAAAHNQHVIATLADQWGDCESTAGPGIYKNEDWYQDGYRTERRPGLPATYREWVQEVVSRYKDNPTILTWQLMNEAEDAQARNGSCSPNAAATLKAWAADMSTLVKSIDPKHLLSIGTIGGGQCGSRGDEYQALHDLPQVDLCEYHDYGQPTVPLPGDAYNGLQVRIDQCRALGKPLFVGEIGIERGEAGSLDNRAALFAAKLEALAQQGVAGWLLWAWMDGPHGGSRADQLSIGPGDPALAVLGRS
ncbi:MAG TPA: cellulase family glycosylhydrolase [Chloroflexota bacterium]|nr:cellulase family glycosylhydrolase [Chloroflexota bacterium]